MLALSDTDLLIRLAMWGGAGLAGIVLLALAAHFARSRFRRDHGDRGLEIWDLRTLERMRQEGRITVEEYDSLRRKVLDAISHTLD